MIVRVVRLLYTSASAFAFAFACALASIYNNLFVFCTCATMHPAHARLDMNLYLCVFLLRTSTSTSTSTCIYAWCAYYWHIIGACIPVYSCVFLYTPLSFNYINVYSGRLAERRGAVGRTIKSSILSLWRGVRSTSCGKSGFRSQADHSCMPAHRITHFSPFRVFPVVLQKQACITGLFQGDA